MIDTTKRIAFLRKIRVFQDIEESKLQELADLLDELAVAESGVIFQENGKSDGFYLIYSGEVSIVKNRNRKDEQTQLLVSGDYFGEQDLISNQRRSATSIAHDDTVLLVLSRIDFEYFYHKFYKRKKFPSLKTEERLFTHNVLDRINLAIRIKLKRLDLSQLGLTSLPPEIGLLTTIESINLRFNKLHNLPPEFERLTNLKRLDLTSNYFENIPLQIYK